MNGRKGDTNFIQYIHFSIDALDKGKAMLLSVLRLLEDLLYDSLRVTRLSTSNMTGGMLEWHGKVVI